MKTTLLLPLAILLFQIASAQIYYVQNDTNIVLQYQAYIADTTRNLHDTTEGDAQNAFLDYYRFWGTRLQPTGSFSVAQQGLQAYYNNFHSNAPLSVLPATWNQMGPIGTSGGNIGRLARVTFDPNNSGVMYAGGWDGGIFKSTNNGANWTAKYVAGDT